ncbi:MAG: hypothetical protein ACR2NO_06330 [Chloroflexota bacterium]
MQSVFPGFSLRLREKGQRAEWTGRLRPTALSQTYVVRIAYQRWDTPRVYVLSPRLEQRPDGRLVPHRYSKSRPCLYLPSANEWDSDRYIADTIIPWTSLWLYFYEVWLATGDWLGGGEHPEAEGKTDLLAESDGKAA